jgi:hypothetical protein
MPYDLSVFYEAAFDQIVTHLIPPLCYSGQSTWLHTQRSRVRFPELTDSLSSSGSRTGSTKPLEDK